MTADFDPHNRQRSHRATTHAAGKHGRVDGTRPFPSTGVDPVPIGGSGHRPMNFGPEKKARSKTIALVVAIVFVIIIALVAAEVGFNAGKVHQGVKVGGVEIGGLSQSEAVDRLQAELDTRLTVASVRVTPGTELLERLEGNTVNETGGDFAASEGTGSAQADTSTVEEGSEGSSLAWSFSAADLGASVDAAPLVEEALGIGEVTGIGDLFPGIGERFAAWFGQVDIAFSPLYDDGSLTTALETVNDAVGVSVVNADIAIDATGKAVPTAGRDGETVDRDIFVKRASEVLTGATASSFDVPMASVSPDIDEAEAQVVADKVNAAIVEPVTFAYEDDSWSVWAPMLGSWTKTEVQGSGEDAKLVAKIDATTAYGGLQQLMGDAGYGTAENAHFDVSSGTPEIIGGTIGVGPDIKTGVHDLDTLLYGSDTTASRMIKLVEAEVAPEVTAEDAANMGIVELVTSFDLAYGSGGGSSREYNIERCLDTLNGSLIAPGKNWNWNEVVGLCDESTGYEAASVIVDNEIVQSAGGGICNVATGVFNAAYDAGLPIVERTNHSIYQPNYPLGRDAAVSWEYPNLVFTNDLESSMLVTASYDGVTMTISIWGTNPHRTIDSANSDWMTTDSGGRSITNHRTVKASDGTVVREDSFYSYFPPEKDKA